MEKSGLFQNCPHCNGTGLEQYGTHGTSHPTCTVCNGQKIISSLTGFPPNSLTLEMTMLTTPIEPAPTEDKKAPVEEVDILLKFANDHSYDTWPEMVNDCHDQVIIEYTVEAMQEHASNEKAKSIRDAIDCFEPLFLISPTDTLEVAKQLKECYNNLLKLKK